MNPLKLSVMVWSAFLLASSAWAQDANTDSETYKLEQQIKRLERRIKKLETQPSGPTEPQQAPGTQPSGTTTPDIYKNLPKGTGSSADSSFSTATGLSRFFNPAISVNGLFLGQYRSIGNTDPNNENSTGFKIQEMELQFTANVDTYLRANFRATFEGDEVGIEESFIDALLMDRLALRAGKFYTSFGKHNLLHTHQFPFIDQPLVNETLFGDEGLLEVGVGTSYLVPVPWYSEAILQVVQGDNEIQFNGPLNNDFLYLAHLKNLWDLDEETTLELGGSFATGRNQAGAQSGSGRGRTNLVGGNMTVKWNPAKRSRYKTLIWQTEYIGSFQQTGTNPVTNVANPDLNRGGMYTMLQYQFQERWWVQGRYDYVGFHQPQHFDDSYRWSGLIGYVPSEFSAIRLQYNYLDQGFSEEQQVLLQLNFSMGSHPAHTY
ncbi:conserved exported hypothetical protein [Nitrospina gracilis 3/211]|uniref:Phosphate-selective porin O and P n=1 Tax=Nitrospina gracilis (strain 3/211) TaxID=1266370 RepID=M1Z174_NITG3|nr:MULTISPECIES: porin [Nitrospina]MCF8724112.1 hypothetical protein [Nitrospina sp. Nb-3]CCQ91254.1 conserved exported hypothetical protein [Nitrospina gracilis 3/211]